MTPGKIVTTAHALGVHTTVVDFAFQEWLVWCEREGVDIEVMTFENWLDEMQEIADRSRHDQDK